MVQKSILLLTLITERIPVVLRHDSGDNLNIPVLDAGFYGAEITCYPRTVIGGKVSGESQVSVR